MKNKTMSAKTMARVMDEERLWSDMEARLDDYTPSPDIVRATWTKRARDDADEILAGKMCYSTVYSRTLRMFEYANENPESPMFGKAKALFEKYVKELNGFLQQSGYRISDHVLSPLRRFGANA